MQRLLCKKRLLNPVGVRSRGGGQAFASAGQARRVKSQTRPSTRDALLTRLAYESARRVSLTASFLCALPHHQHVSRRPSVCITDHRHTSELIASTDPCPQHLSCGHRRPCSLQRNRRRPLSSAPPTGPTSTNTPTSTSRVYNCCENTCWRGRGGDGRMSPVRAATTTVAAGRGR